MRALSEKRLSDYMAQQIADEILSGRIARRDAVKAGRTGRNVWNFENSNQRSISGIRGTGADCPSGYKKNLCSRIIGRADSDYL